MRSDATPRAWRPRRRGVTLIEMMVTVALVILIMTIIVSVFRTTTNAVRGAQISQELDGNLRRLDATLRQDLVGATARFTPPLDPKDNLGYFEYGENSFADAQGEDTDDWLAFTVKAPPGQPFLGRYWNPNPNITNQASNPAIQPTIISSQYAEVIYFLRNGNLYRRVLLIVPQLDGNLVTLPNPWNTGFTPGTQSGMALGGQPVGWFGVNDISARPSPAINGYGVPVPNTLGDLTNRENRAFRPRFTSKYIAIKGVYDDFGGEGTTANPLPNGIPDYYPTLYPNVLTSTLTRSNSVLVNEVYFPRTPPPAGSPGITPDTMPFPYLYPGSYSIADSDGSAANGAIHGWTSTTPVGNHSPLDLGDPLNATNPAQLQTYWSWPTWRETLSPNWTDPVLQPVNNGGAQSPGLSGVSSTFKALPPMTTAYRALPQPFTDGAGDKTGAGFAATGSAFFFAWEDDLIMTGVRSFDIKAYDPNALTPGGQPIIAGVTPGYYDLGYNASNWVSGFGLTANQAGYAQANLNLQTFGHEGRIPPLMNDSRLDAQYPTLVSAGTSYFLDVGEDSATTTRLRRVWDSWSTAYTNAPDLSTNPQPPPSNPNPGPVYGGRPVYPSYSPPYPGPLRGIQIQIRVVNQPDSDRVKVLTIRQDFTDKL